MRAPAALAFLGLALACARGGARQDPAAPSAEELFQARCTSCHVPPDPAFAVERAWIEQVKDTA
jgi:hypothetical protein